MRSSLSIAWFALHFSRLARGTRCHSTRFRWKRLISGEVAAWLEARSFLPRELLEATRGGLDCPGIEMQPLLAYG
jgi:hypothetical protein